MARLAKLWPGLASAVLFNLAFAPFHLYALVFVALAPWLASLRESGARGFRSGFGFGFLMMLGQMYWEVPFVSRWTGSLALALVPWLISGVITAMYFGIAASLMRVCWKNGWPWLVPLVWVGMEVFRSYLPVLAFPWALLATPLHEFPPLMGLAHFGMIFIASAWCFIPNQLLSDYLRGAKLASLQTGLAVFAVGLAGSITYWSLPNPSTTKLIGAAQPGEDLAFGDPLTADDRIAAALRPQIAGAKVRHADLLVMPEGVAGATSVMPPRPSFGIDPAVPLLFGGERGDDPRYQTAFAYDGKWSYADKTRLVIFGEFVPGRNWVPGLSYFKLPSGDLSASDKVVSLDVGGIRVGPLLCFEGLFPDLGFRHARNGARLLATMAIDDWYMGSPAPEQLAAAAPWRAVETGMPLVRSATTGITEAVDGRGNVVGRLPVGEPRALFVRLGIPTEPTVFRFAPLFPIVCLLSLVVVPIADRWKGRAKRKKDAISMPGLS